MSPLLSRSRKEYGSRNSGTSSLKSSIGSPRYNEYSASISATLAKAIPDGKETVVDINEGILTRARTVAEETGVSNIEFQVADARKLPFADASFDITHCHQVLCHLKDPWEILQEMLRVTKPGGVVAAREGDYKTDCYWPQSPGLDKFQAFIAGVLQHATAGRELLSWALKTGVRRDQVTFSFGTWCYAEKEERAIWGMTYLFSGLYLLTLIFSASSSHDRSNPYLWSHA